MFEDKTTYKGGARKGAGRKPFKTPTKEIKIRLTEPQHLKLKKLGGSKWVVKKLDEEIDV